MIPNPSGLITAAYHCFISDYETVKAAPVKSTVEVLALSIFAFLGNEFVFTGILGGLAIGLYRNINQPMDENKQMDKLFVHGILGGMMGIAIDKTISDFLELTG